MRESDRDDAALMQDLIAGDQKALGPLIARWEKPLYCFAFRYTQHEQTARDIVQETMVRLFSKRDKYNPDFPLSTWLFSIASNLCKNHFRWMRRHPECAWDARESGQAEDAPALQDKIASLEPTPVEEEERRVRAELLRKQIDQLPHNLKVVLLLRHFEHLSYQEIGEICGCSQRGVETRLYRARKKLKTKLKIVWQSDLAEKKTPLHAGRVVEIRRA